MMHQLNVELVETQTRCYLGLQLICDGCRRTGSRWLLFGSEDIAGNAMSEALTTAWRLLIALFISLAINGMFSCHHLLCASIGHTLILRDLHTVHPVRTFLCARRDPFERECGR